MRVRTVAAVVIAAVALSSSADPEKPKPSPAELAAELRGRLLHGTAEEFSIEPVGSVWGVLMEMGRPTAAATLVTLNDGNASLYSSSGGGVIGGGQSPDINSKARRMAAMASTQLAKFSPTSEFPLPASGEVKFYVLTTKGVLTAAAPDNSLAARDHPLSELFFAGQDVITGLRLASEKRSGVSAFILAIAAVLSLAAALHLWLRARGAALRKLLWFGVVLVPFFGPLLYAALYRAPSPQPEALQAGQSVDLSAAGHNTYDSHGPP